MATYREIEEYIKKQHGFTVKPCWIAHMKEICGLPVKKSHNREKPDVRKHECPENKQEVIREAFEYFKML